jgi:hypothetical protein
VRKTSRNEKYSAPPQVGAPIRNSLTREEGRIVRIVSIPDILPEAEPGQRQQSAYIVALPSKSLSPAREELWFAFEVESSPATRPIGNGTAVVDDRQVCRVCGKFLMQEDRKMDALGKLVHSACHACDSVSAGV